MALIEIGNGAEVLSSPLNSNFEYLDDKITDTNTSLSTSISSLQASLSTISTNLSNNKANKDLSNVTDIAQVKVVTEANKTGSSWYRVYDDKWCEQGSVSSAGTITFTKAYADGTATVVGNGVSSITSTGFSLGTAGGWIAMGYLP